MTTAYALLCDLIAQGVIIAADGDSLGVDGPDNLLTNELLSALRKRKAALLDLLADENEEMHNSALFDVVVGVDFYDGCRIRIPQTSTPAGWASPF